MVAAVGVFRDSATVFRATVRILLVFVSAAYKADSSCDAVNVTVPCPTSVIIPLLSIVATVSSFDEYVIAPVLEPIGTVVIANDASPYVLFVATANVDAENPDTPLFTVMPTVPLASVKLALAA